MFSCFAQESASISSPPVAFSWPETGCVRKTDLDLSQADPSIQVSLALNILSQLGSSILACLTIYNSRAQFHLAFFSHGFSEFFIFLWGIISNVPLSHFIQSGVCFWKS